MLARSLSKLLLLAVSVLGVAGLSACSNNGFLGAMGNRNPLTLQDSIEDGVETETDLLTLTRVVRSNADPGSGSQAGSFDFIGDGTGSMGRFCVSATGDSTGTSAGPSTCQCVYKYTLNGNEESFRTDTVYREGDLIRCKNQIPGGATQVSVRVYLTNSDTYSNELTLSTSSGTSDPGAANPVFRQIERYQCRDAVFVPYPFDPRIYHPLLSDDPKYSYQLNFFSNNIGGALAHFVSSPDAQPQNGTGWICPQNPFDLANPLAAYGAEDPRILRSKAPLEDGSGNTCDRIYDPGLPAAHVCNNGAFADRSSFHLSTRASGMFNVRVNAYIAPNTPSYDPVPPLGYGVSPVPALNGTAEEYCPADDQAPNGYKWVKVWLFRASLAERMYPSSPLLSSLSISCNPGNWADGSYVVRGCDDGGAGTAVSINQAGEFGPFASRVVGPDAGACATPDFGGNFAAGFAPGTDSWTNINTSCSASNGNDLTTCANPVAPSTPYDPNPVTPKSIDGGVSRYDFTFVVSPPTVMTWQMKDPTLKVTQQHTPVRNYPATSNPIVYGLRLHDALDNADSSSGDTGRKVVFPVCALQRE